MEDYKEGTARLRKAVKKLRRLARRWYRSSRAAKRNSCKSTARMMARCIAKDVDEERYYTTLAECECKNRDVGWYD